MNNFCVKCGTKLENGQRFCASCGNSTNVQPPKKKNSALTTIAIVFGVILLIGGISSLSEDLTDYTEKITTTEKKEVKKEYKQDEIASYKQVNYSITKIEKTKGSNEYFQAKEGYEYVKVTIKIENKSNKKISYNSLNFQMVNGDGVEASIYSITAEEDVMLDFGELDAGGTVEGVIIWEQKENDNNLKLRYYDNVLFDDEYTFQFLLN